jgi:hypothetical protein
MPATYAEFLAQMQEQTLESLKAVQNSYLQSLTAARELVEKLPKVPSFPTVEGVPTVAELTELNTQFVDKVVEQQKAYAKQLADIFTPTAV